MGLKFFLCVASSMDIRQVFVPRYNANTKVLKDKLLTKWEKVGQNGAKWLKSIIFTPKPAKTLWLPSLETIQ
jgi:hypothetical protein